ncbi:MAG: FecR family protein [Chitinophagaceae bacterium]
MDDLSKYDIPWELITASLLQDLSAEEASQLQQWLSADTANQEKYNRLAQIWHGDLADFSVYQSADETTGWEALQKKSAALSLPAIQSPVVVTGQFTGRMAGMRKWVAVAAVFILTIGVVYWYSGAGNKELVYQTAANEQKNITLPDGSTILLKPLSQVTVAGTYNKQTRKVTLVNGEAFFSVIHQPQLPFIVNAGPSTIRDIGTSFTIRKTGTTIKVAVVTGKVAFTGNKTNESRELSEGMAISYDIPAGRFDEAPVLGIPASDSTTLLHFDSTPLSEVINIVQKVYRRKMA